MNYKLNLGSWNNVFCVPSVVVDNYIKLASGDNLKIILFFLRNAGTVMEPANAASLLGLSEEQVSDGLEFWVQRGIILKSDGDMAPSNQMQPAQIIQASPTISAAKKVALERAPDFAPAEIAATVRGNNKADYLFKRCESLYGRALKHNEQRSLMLIIEDVGMPVEVALVMIEYCFSIDKATPSYMRKVALEWTEREIDTIEKAEKRIIEMKSFNTAVSRFKRMFEVNSAFSKQQLDMINKWVNSFCFDDEIINEAYQITLNSTGKLAFSYMDKILSDWHDKGYKTLEAVNFARQKRDKKKNEESKNTASFDIDQLEELSNRKYKQSQQHIKEVKHEL